MDRTSQTEQGRRSSELPQELSDAIVEYLWDDEESLKQCCLTSSSFRPICQKLIFECVCLIPLEDYEAPTMAWRLNNALQSSPHLSQFIKDLRICNVDDTDWSAEFGGWLEDDTSLSHILPLLVNLERFYVSGSINDESRIDMIDLSRPVRDAFFTTWKSPKLTHVGIHSVVFPSFKDLASVLTDFTTVREVALCFVDVRDDLEDEEMGDAGDQSNDINGKPVIQTPSTVTRTSAIDSLALFPQFEVSSRINRWFMSPKSSLPFSSLRRLHLNISLQDDLLFFRQILRACPSLEELHITMSSLVEPVPRDPVDISSLRAIHIAIGLGEYDRRQPSTQHPTLSWWCDSLASSRSLNLTDLDIYLLPPYDKLAAPEWQLEPECNRLDEILSSGGRSINLKIWITEHGPEFELENPLKPLETRFSRMLGIGRLDVGYVDNRDLICHYGAHWVEEF